MGAFYDQGIFTLLRLGGSGDKNMTCDTDGIFIGQLHFLSSEVTSIP